MGHHFIPPIPPRMHQYIGSLLFCCTAIAIGYGDEQASEAPAAIAKRIDTLIDGHLQAQQIQPADGISDEGFLRRITLDLAGRIPTIAEQDAFVALPQASRRAEWIEKLLSSPDYAYHQRNQLDILLLLRLENNGSWREYLLEATKENRKWDQMFREIIVPEKTRADDTRPVSFINKRLSDLDALTNDTSIVWFGVNIACAKCHDHPLVSDWTQSHYYGMQAFFKRTFRTKKGKLGERLDGLPKFTDIGGDQYEAQFMFLNGTPIEPPPIELSDEEKKQFAEQVKKSEKDAGAEPPQPPFQPRAQLAELALNDGQQHFFARNIANRLWARFFGRGIVHPLDQMHSENPPSHPELLEYLSEQIEANQFDMRHLIHGIVLSESYAKSIRIPEASSEVPPEHFASSVARPLTPRQLSLSLHFAGSHPDKTRGVVDLQAWETQREQMEKKAEGVARRLEIPSDGFQVSVTEALWFSNDSGVQREFLSQSKDRLLGHLKEIADPPQQIQRLFRIVLGRGPEPEELKAIDEYLIDRADRPDEALQQVAWALMSSPEFRFNH